MSRHAAFAKVRAKIRREIAEVEEAEHEGGEINLVPYLDIVTNTVIFMLATTATAVALANINVQAPRYSPPSATASSDTPDDPSEKKEKLNLTIAISNRGFIVAGAGGVMKAPDDTLPTIKCTSALTAGRCPAYIAKRHNAKLGIEESYWVDKYDHKALRELLQKIKSRFGHERRAILSADRSIPYQIVVNVMDTVRGKHTAKCTGDDNCLFDQIVLSAGVQ